MQRRHIPIFPLNILPLQDEVIPLHIFEPRYRQLLEDVVKNDMDFGILFVSPENEERVGTLVNLVSVIKKYPTGESDIVVKGGESFILDRYYKNYKDKLYSGAEVVMLENEEDDSLDELIAENFHRYSKLINSNYDEAYVTIHDLANTLELENQDRVKYLKILDKAKKEKFLLKHLKYRLYILEQEIKYKNSYSLN